MRRIDVTDYDYDDLDRAADALGITSTRLLSQLVQDYLPELLEANDLDPREVLS